MARANKHPQIRDLPESQPKGRGLHRTCICLPRLRLVGGGCASLSAPAELSGRDLHLILPWRV